MKGALLYEGDDCVGYAYVNSIGHVGPVAVAQPDAMGAAFRTALHLAAETGALAGLGLCSRRQCFGARRRKSAHGMRIIISNGAGLGARFRRLDPVSSAQSGIHVIIGPRLKATKRRRPDRQGGHAMTRPFEGIRVIDVTHVLAGPFAAYQLAVLGADVIKVEHPTTPIRAAAAAPTRRSTGAAWAPPT